MSINRLYDTWFQRIERLWPDSRVTQVRNLAWLLVGMCQSRSVHLTDIVWPTHCLSQSDSVPVIGDKLSGS